jgi:hypothetical protein
MTWSSLTLTWPAQSTEWLAALNGPLSQAATELDAAAGRIDELAGSAGTDPNPVGAAAAGAITGGRQGLAGLLAEVKALVINPFQHGQGSGLQQHLSAPNLLQLMAGQLTAGGDPHRPIGRQHGLAVLVLSTELGQLAQTLAVLNAVLPLPSLQRTERRAGQLARLEGEKWLMPASDTAPKWRAQGLLRSTWPRQAQQAMSAQLAALEGYAADTNPTAELAALADRKAARMQAQAQQLADLRAATAGGGSTLRALWLGEGDPAELRDVLLDSDAPGHEWGLCAGVLLTGPQPAMNYLKELFGL